MESKKSIGKRIRRYIKWLRKSYPIETKVIISRRPLKDDWARVTVRLDGMNNQYHIYLNSNGSYQEQSDAITHEWSHIRGFEEIRDHKGRWGEIYGEIYRSWEHTEITQD